MTARKRNPLTPQQIGQLGGLAAAHALGPEGMRMRGQRGGDAVVAKYGKQWMVRLSHRSHGRLLGK